MASTESIQLQPDDQRRSRRKPVDTMRLAGQLGLAGLYNLRSRTEGFDLRDTYLSLAVARDQARDEVQAQQAFLDSTIANFITYCLEKDTSGFELIFALGGVEPRPRFSTRDHEGYADLSYMALAAAKKVRSEGGDWLKETAMLKGVRQLRRLLLQGSRGDSFILLYPPLPEGDTSIVYVYTLGEAQLDGYTDVHVQGKMLPLNVEGMARLYTELRGRVIEAEAEIEGDTKAVERYLVATPFQLDQEPDLAFRTAHQLSLERMFHSGADMGRLMGFEAVSSEYEAQAIQAGQFLSRRIELVYRSRGGELMTAEDLQELELVFSFARRAVTHLSQRGFVLGQAEIEQLWSQQLQYRFRRPTMARAREFNNALNYFFGELGAAQEFARLCGVAMLAGLGVEGGSGLGFDAFGGFQLPTGNHDCVPISCKNCGCSDIKEGATRCPKCGADKKGNKPRPQTPTVSHQKKQLAKTMISSKPKPKTRQTNTKKQRRKPTSTNNSKSWLFSSN